MLVAVPNATAGTIVQIYQAADCSSSPEGRTLLQTDTFSPSGTLVATVPLQSVGTPLVARLTTSTNGTPATDHTDRVLARVLRGPARVRSGHSDGGAAGRFGDGDSHRVHAR